MGYTFLNKRTNIQLAFLLFLFFCQVHSLILADEDPISDEKSGDSFFIDTIAATINDDVVTVSELYRNFLWNKIISPPEAESTDIEKSILNLLKDVVDKKLIMQEINKTQFLSVPKIHVDRIYDNYANQLGSREKLLKVLRQVGFTKDEFYLYLWQEIMIKTYSQQKFGSRIKIRERDITEYLQQHYQAYNINYSDIENMNLEPIQSVRDRVRTILHTERLHSMLREKVRELRKNASVTIFYRDLLNGSDFNNENGKETDVSN